MSRSPFRSFAAWLCLLLPLVLGLTADLVSKHVAFARLVQEWVIDTDGQPQARSRTVRTLPGWLQFQAHVNRGAVFGIAQNQRTVFVAVSFVALALLVYLFSRSNGSRLYQVLLGILFAGVLGNLYDRVVFGYVRDMIWILPGWDVFPWIFNIADSLLCTGVGGMILYSFWHGDHQFEDHPAPVEAKGRA